MKITEEGKRYTATREFAVRLGETVEYMLARYGSGPESYFAGNMFTAMCLTGFGRCKCPVMCRDEMQNFHAAGGKKFILDNEEIIKQTIIQAASVMGLTAVA